MSLATDFAAMIADQPDKETVWYDSGDGAPRQVTVVVVRDPNLFESIDGILMGSKVREVDLVNDATLGVAVPKVNHDTIHMKANIWDEEDCIFRVESVLYQDPGKYRLRVVA